MSNLHLGCGCIYKEGWINVDKSSFVKTDLTWDLEDIPWPWKTETVDKIWMDQVLEHLSNTVKVIEEVHRILKFGGVFEGLVPFAGSIWAFQDPTHKAFFTERSFVYYDKKRPKGTPKYSACEFSKVETYLVANKVTILNRLRNIIPMRILFRWFLWNMYDNVYFKLIK